MFYLKRLSIIQGLYILVFTLLHSNLYSQFQRADLDVSVVYIGRSWHSLSVDYEDHSYRGHAYGFGVYPVQSSWFSLCIRNEVGYMKRKVSGESNYYYSDRNPYSQYRTHTRVESNLHSINSAMVYRFGVNALLCFTPNSELLPTGISFGLMMESPLAQWNRSSCTSSVRRWGVSYWDGPWSESYVRSCEIRDQEKLTIDTFLHTNLEWFVLQRKPSVYPGVAAGFDVRIRHFKGAARNKWLERNREVGFYVRLQWKLSV